MNENHSAYTLVSDGFKQSFSELSIPPGAIGLANTAFAEVVRSSFPSSHLFNSAFLDKEKTINRLHTEIRGGDFYIYAGREENKRTGFYVDDVHSLRISGVSRVYVQSSSDDEIEGNLLFMCRSERTVVCKSLPIVGENSFSISLTSYRDTRYKKEILISGTFEKPLPPQERKVDACIYNLLRSGR